MCSNVLMVDMGMFREVRDYQTGVELVLSGQDDLWGVGHDVDFDLLLLPGINVCFL